MEDGKGGPVRMIHSQGKSGKAWQGRGQKSTIRGGQLQHEEAVTKVLLIQRFYQYFVSRVDLHYLVAIQVKGAGGN